MPAAARDILTLLLELEQGDPLDLGTLPLDEQQARKLVVLSMEKFSQDLAAAGIAADARETLALATAARLLLDNLKLNYRVLTASGAPAPDVQVLLRSISQPRSPR